MERAGIFEIANLRPLGRFQETSARKAGVLPLFWANSGFELSFNGSALQVILEADYSHAEPWIVVEINGAPMIRMPLNRGINQIFVFQNMLSKSVKHVRLLKELQPVWDDPRHHLWVRELRWTDDGEFLPLPKSPYRLEFIGDSLTSGEGVIGADQEMDWAACLFSASRSWAKRAADLLGAEFQTICQSGWGILSGWDNDPRRSIPAIYESVCGPASGTPDRALGAQEPHDFSSWQPDAIIINLGSNDAAAMFEKPWHHPDNHNQIFQQTADAAGIRHFEEATLQFLQMLRRCNPNAAIIWAFGMLEEYNFLRNSIEKTIAKFQSEALESNSGRAYYLPLPMMQPGGFGSRMHPGIACHRRAADITAKFLLDILGKT